MTLFCTLGYAAVLYAGTITTGWHTSQDISGPSTELQTCRDGFGGRVAFGEQWVQVGPQFGQTWPISGLWSITAQIHGGLGYSNTHHPSTGVRQVTKFNAGVSVSLNYGRCGLKIGGDHMSNGRGHDPTNAGQDLWSAGVGCSIF
ncbi:MAG: hypothetical protein OEY86_07560 [Nitrospira sp.]|nr:hypothetical protein [Nitrospira sp.]